ncbi:anticodon nuclease [Candidatus Magnetomorum sp. HK-1]|nr:anticodon nuclease [Candidatus Magnetomorum sp. HK-1]
MSNEIPVKIQRDILKKNILKKLKHKDYENLEYEVLIKNNYSFQANTNEFILKDDIDEDIISEINFIFKRIGFTHFDTVEELSGYFRKLMNIKKYILVFAYNGTGKTRLSSAFKDLGKRNIASNLTDEAGNELVTENGDSIVSEEKKADTLYYNAFTEDLFIWDNDLENDTQRVLRLNNDSRFFNGLESLEMESRIRLFLSRYADFDFTIDYNTWSVSFSRELRKDDATEKIENIKVSRGEENIFIWCFFLAVAQLAIDKDDAYEWVKYIYIDDPISSLDDNNAIAVASHLAQLLKKQSDIKTVISTHHTLFFNVMYNELKKAEKYFLSKNKSGEYMIRNTGDTPFFHHVALLKELYEVAEAGNLYTYHFNILRNILEKTATFHGFQNFSACIKQDADDLDGTIHTRLVNLLSHGNYSLFEPKEMLEDNKEYFKKILNDFMANYRFNPELFPEEVRT